MKRFLKAMTKAYDKFCRETNLSPNSLVIHPESYAFLKSKEKICIKQFFKLTFVYISESVKEDSFCFGYVQNTNVEYSQGIVDKKINSFNDCTRIKIF